MSRPTRTKTPTWKAAATSDVVDSAMPSDDDEPPKSPQQPLPMSSNPAEDALTDTTRALSSGSPSLQTLQRECEDLLAGELAPLKSDLILKLASIFTYEEILAKAHATHGDSSLSHAALACRLKDAKGKVAKARGVERKQVSDELDANRKLSGALERKVKLAGARATATRTGRMEKLERLEGVERSNKFVIAGRSIGIGEVGAEPEMPDEGEAGRKRKRADGDVLDGYGIDEVGDPVEMAGGGGAGLKRKRVKDDEEDDDFSVPKALRRPGKSTAAAAGHHRVSSSSVEPFDPTPYGQPYAGTSLYVPGFRTFGKTSWQEWLEDNLYPHEVYWDEGSGGESPTDGNRTLLYGLGAGQSTTGPDVEDSDEDEEER